MSIFSRKPDLKEQVRGWRSQIKHEVRNLEREITKIQREQDKTKAQVKQYAVKGDIVAAKTLCVEITRTNKSIERMYIARAQLNSVDNQMATNLASARMGQTMGLSTDMMKSMSNLIKMPQLTETMKTMYKEMEKAGYAQEIMDSTMDDALGVENEEELANEQIDQVLNEITSGQFSGLTTGKTITTKESVVNSTGELEERFNNLKIK